MNTQLRRDPLARDDVRRRSGRAFRKVGKPDAVARVLGVSPRYVQMMASGERGAFAQVCEMVAALVRAGLKPWSLIVMLKSIVYEAYMDASDAAQAQQVRRLMVEETRAQGDLDPLQMGFDPETATPAEILVMEQRTADHAERLEEILAMLRKIRRAKERAR